MGRPATWLVSRAFRGQALLVRRPRKDLPLSPPHFLASGDTGTAKCSFRILPIILLKP